MTRNKKLKYTTIASLLFQMTTIICGFIVPRLILNHFGSEVNGLVTSITQFLSIISFLEMGMGAVVQSSLYKPLAINDNEAISKIIVSAERFFKRIAKILLVYIFLLLFIYPIVSKYSFGWLYTSTLILSISISSFAQYYFGVVDRLLLTADQRGYIQYNTQTISLILNTLACFILLNYGASIQIVKLSTSLIFLLRPFCLRIYVNKKYQIDRKISYTGEPIKQKWNGVAQHIAAVILDGTDIIVLTLFSTFSNVSIYSVYHLVVYGVKQLFLSLTSGIQALIGNLWANNKIIELKSAFQNFEWLIHTGTIIVFGCTMILIVPFVQVYTFGIDDINYVQPCFAFLITLANAMHCLRLPYNIIILAAGHYKQTQYFYATAAVINIIISILTVKLWGLIGVAIGTLSAMTFHTIWMVFYVSNHVLKISIYKIIKQFFSDFIIMFFAIIASSFFDLKSYTYYSWFVMAIKVFIVWVIISGVFNFLFYKENTKQLLRKIKLI